MEIKKLEMKNRYIMASMFFCLLLLSIFIFSCSRNSSTNNQINTNIRVVNSTVVKFIGDTFLLNNNIVIIEPNNAHINRVEIFNPNVANFNAETNSITAIAPGQTTVAIFVNAIDGVVSASFILIVADPATHETGIVFENIQINMNFDSVGIINTLFVSFQNGTSAEFSNNINFRVSYNEEDVIVYNPITGIITAGVLLDTTREIIVTVYITTAINTTLSASFTVTITNYIFSTSFEIANLDIEQTLVLFIGERKNLDLSIAPANYNRGIIARVSNSAVTLSGSTIIAGNNTGPSRVTIEVRSGYNTTIEVAINILVVAPIESFTFYLVNEQGDAITQAFINPNTNYRIIFNGLTFIQGRIEKYINTTTHQDVYNLFFRNGNFYINFTSAGLNTHIALTFRNVSSFSEIIIISETVTLDVFNTTAGFNVSATSNNRSVQINNNEYEHNYTLNLINQDYAEYATRDRVVTYLRITITELGPGSGSSLILENNFDVVVRCLESDTILSLTASKLNFASIYVNQNIITVTAHALGEFEIILISRDVAGVSRILTFGVVNTYINELLLDEEELLEIILHINAPTGKFHIFDLSEITFAPLYTNITALQLEICSDIAMLKDGKIIAINQGTGHLLITSGQFNVEVELIIRLAVTDIYISNNGKPIQNNGIIMIEDLRRITTYTIVALSNLYNIERINSDDFSIFYLDDNNKKIETSNIVSITINQNQLMIRSLNYGSQKFMIVFNDGVTKICLRFTVLVGSA